MTELGSSTVHWQSTKQLELVAQNQWHLSIFKVVRLSPASRSLALIYSGHCRCNQTVLLLTCALRPECLLTWGPWKLKNLSCNTTGKLSGVSSYVAALDQNRSWWEVGPLLSRGRQYRSLLCMSLQRALIESDSDQQRSLAMTSLTMHLAFTSPLHFTLACLLLLFPELAQLLLALPTSSRTTRTHALFSGSASWAQLSLKQWLSKDPLDGTLTEQAGIKEPVLVVSGVA